MKKEHSIKRFIILLLAITMLGGAPLTAQTDSRNRTSETIVADALAQLPSNDHATLVKVIGEIAAVGEQGVVQIASQMLPPEQGKSSVQEYALSALTDFTTTTEGEKYRAGVRNGLVKAVESSSYAPHKAFLLGLLSRCATASDAPLFVKYLSDADMSEPALAALAAIPGIDDAVVSVVKGSSAPRAKLAKLVKERSLSGCEDVLIGWISGADAETLKEIYSALAIVGGSKSLDVLATAAKQAAYVPEATSATDAYITALNRLSATDVGAVVKGAKALQKSENTSLRCAGLRLQMQADNANATKAALKALKGDCSQLRNTALDCGKEYCGDGFASSVMGAYGRLSDAAKLDVVRWCGDNHVAESVDNITMSMSSTNVELATAAIEAASKIGGEKALQAIIAQLGTQNSDAAKTALLSFNGEINSVITQTLSSADKKKVSDALQVASTRRIHEAYGKVVALTKDSDKAVSDAAYDALGGVATAENFGDLCSMLNKSHSDATAKLQQATLKSVQSETQERQYELAVKAMQQADNRSLYYPLLAQAGTSEAIKTLQSEKNAAADNALLTIDNIEMLPIMLDMAKAKAVGGERDAVLSRYIALVTKSQMTAEERYVRLSMADDLNPGAEVRNRIITAMGQTRTLQALSFIRKYYDAAAHNYASAEGVKEIIGHVDDLNGGKNVRALLEVAKAVYEAKAIDDADAGYAVDNIKGLIAKTKTDGYIMSTEQTNMGKNGFWNMKEQFENFNLSFDWATEGVLTVTLRSMPILIMDNSRGVQMVGSTEWKAYESMGEWNTADVKVVDDRLFVTVNGHKLIENAVMKNPEKGKSLNVSGFIGFGVQGESLSVRYTRIRKLPSTPVFTLSAEEKKAGYEVLFDGRSLEKWQGNTSNYVPQDGTIYVSARYGGNGNLYTKKKYSDFVFRFEFCFVRPGVNNGVGIRTNIGTDAAYDGMEIQVLDHDDPIYKSLRPYQWHGSVYGIIVPEHVDFGKVGTWHTEEIRAVGDNITVTVDGKVILKGNIREACQGHNIAPDGSEKNPYTVDHKNHPGLFNKSGYISFCGHGEGIKFRNVRILDLSKKKR